MTIDFIGLLIDVALALGLFHLYRRPVLHLSEPLAPAPQHPVTLTRIPCIFLDGEHITTRKVRLTAAGRPPSHYKKGTTLYKLSTHRNPQGYWTYKKVNTLK